MLLYRWFDLHQTIRYYHFWSQVTLGSSAGLSGAHGEYDGISKRLQIAPWKNHWSGWFNEFIVASARIVEPVEESCQASWMLQLGMSATTWDMCVRTWIKTSCFICYDISNLGWPKLDKMASARCQLRYEMSSMEKFSFMDELLSHCPPFTWINCNTLW